VSIKEVRRRSDGSFIARGMTWGIRGWAGLLFFSVGGIALIDYSEFRQDVDAMGRAPLPAGTPNILLASTAPVSYPRTDGFEGLRGLWLPPGNGFAHGSAGAVGDEALTAVVQRNCVACHNDQILTAGLSLQEFDVGAAPEQAEIAEKVIHKLRAGMMPPPGVPRPSGDTLDILVETLERHIDGRAASDPNPGHRPFQRLNQAEYAASIRDLLGLEINPELYLPPDARSGNFDNIADAQLLSPTLLDAYLRAAADVSRLAVGDPHVAATSVTYTNSGFISQWERVPGAPRGTRGGLSVTHNFPVDGEYWFQLFFEHTTTGGFTGGVTPGEQIGIFVDGELVTLLEVDRWMHPQDPNGASMSTDPVFVRAGPRRLSAAFIQISGSLVEDLVSPHDWSLADRHAASSGYGMTGLAHLKDVVVRGPYNATGVSETPSRQRVFTCTPASESEERVCAEEIIERLGTRAFRRPLTSSDMRALMSAYDQWAGEGGFETGVRIALQAILAMPDFIFRLEASPGDAQPGQVYRVSDMELATRLSFFLWGAPPDRELIELAQGGKLSEPGALEAHARRMIADPRAEALGTRFAAQWLRLADLDSVDPDRQMFPDFHQQLKEAMRRETEIFFHSIVQEDRSVLELLEADYTYLNERLARHYGVPGIAGEHFRRVEVADDRRKGLLGHASVLTSTSHANRTSPVNRGLWILEVLLGIEPPPPPPVPPLDETAASADGAFLTTRERLAMHRNNPTCNSCHQFIDPLGVPLENFDVTGKWRIREQGSPVDSRDQLWDGTAMEGPADLRDAILSRPVPVLRNFTQQLMTYALGRRVEYYDMPVVRQIVADAEENGYRVSSFLLGVIGSDAFQMKRVPEAVATDEDGWR